MPAKISLGSNIYPSIKNGQVTKRSWKHGFGGDGARRHPVYKIWDAMIQRCTNPKNKRYKDYGGRGIKVCERWRDFAKFFSDVGDRPTPQHQLDRKNNDGDYSPENCRWATRKEQQRNMRTNRVFTVHGVTGCMAELAEHFKISVGAVNSRINRSGWTPEAAFTTPVSC